MNVEQAEPQTYEAPKSGGAKKGFFACGGIGCILLLLLCGGAIGMVGYSYFSFNKTFTEAKTQVESNEQVIQALGEPIEVSQQTGGFQMGEEGAVEMEFPVTGSNAEGTLLLTIKGESLFSTKIVGLTVETEDGETIDVLNSDEFGPLEVDDPDAEAVDE